MGIENRDTILKGTSKYSNYKVTTKWEKAEEVILLTTQNGGASTTDAIPGGGVRQRVEQIQRNQSDNFSDVVSSSEFSILSLSFSEESNRAQQGKSEKSRIPIPRQSNIKTSLFSNGSKNKNPKIFEFDIKGRLIILSQDHPFLKNIDSKRKKIPQSYRNAFRIDNLTDQELEDLNSNYIRKAMVIGKSN